MENERNITWLRKATGLGEALPDIYDRELFPDFEPNGAGPARIFWKISGGWLVPDWWPLTVAWRDRWKMTAAADLHDFRYWTGGQADDRLAADKEYRKVLVAAGKEIQGWPAMLHRIRRKRMAFMARLYYAGVRSLGKGSFHYAHKRQPYASAD